METWVLEEAEKYYHSGADIPFNFNLVTITPECKGKEIKELIDSWMRLMPPGKWPNFVVSKVKVTSILIINLIIKKKKLLESLI